MTEITLTIASKDDAKLAIELLRAYIVFGKESTSKELGTSLPELDSIELPLTARTMNVLKVLGIETTEQLLRHSSSDLLRADNFGRKSLRELRDVLAKHNLFLRGDEDRAKP